MIRQVTASSECKYKTAKNGFYEVKIEYQRVKAGRPVFIQLLKPYPTDEIQNTATTTQKGV